MSGLTYTQQQDLDRIVVCAAPDCEEWEFVTLAEKERRAQVGWEPPLVCEHMRPCTYKSH